MNSCCLYVFRCEVTQTLSVFVRQKLLLFIYHSLSANARFYPETTLSSFLVRQLAYISQIQGLEQWQLTILSTYFPMKWSSASTSTMMSPTRQPYSIPLTLFAKEQALQFFSIISHLSFSFFSGWLSMKLRMMLTVESVDMSSTQTRRQLAQLRAATEVRNRSIRPYTLFLPVATMHMGSQFSLRQPGYAF